MKIEVGQEWVDQSGSRVRIICTDRKSDEYPVIGLLLEHGQESVLTYQKDGKFFKDPSKKLGKDLIALIKETSRAPSQHLIAYWNKNNGKIRYFKAADHDEYTAARNGLGPGWERMPLLDK